MIQFDKISKKYGTKSLFDNISFSINKSEKCGLLGRNGCGKTTLFRLIINQETADSGIISIPKNYSFGYLDQHIVFTENTVHMEAIKSLPPQEKDNIYKAEKILFGLGFHKKDMEKKPSEFSGGYQLRLHLAKVLLSEPSCLLLDEPTNYLDILSINWFKRFLKSWRGECVIISHDRDFLDSVTTHNIAIHRNKIYKVDGDTKKLYELILKEEEIYEKTRINSFKKRAKAEAFIARFSAKATKASQAQSKMKALEKVAPLEKLIEIQDLRFFFKEAPFPGKKMLSSHELSFSYDKDGSIQSQGYLINKLQLEVEKGDRIAIIGENGLGKSTILKLLSKELAPITGSLNISENTRIGYFGQTNINRLNPILTVREEISLGNRELNDNEILSVCGIMMFSDGEADKKISTLSGGEKSRVLLGKIIATPCNLLLLDEPTNHLDVESIESLLDAIESFSGSIIIVTHSELILRRLALNKLIICDQGKQTLFLGSYDDFLDKIGWPGYISNKKADTKKVDENGIRKKRAELIQERSLVLKVLKKEILSLENEIINIEKKLEDDKKNLIDASTNSNSSDIVKLSKAIFDNNLKIEGLFDKLEKLSIEYEGKKANYDKEIEAL
ncbi:MAG: ABC-F family ATP-binding cassette domain-containing protein [Parachlamydiales bacterium]|jgi:ATP-binding cassette subfamily F protein 3